MKTAVIIEVWFGGLLYVGLVPAGLIGVSVLCEGWRLLVGLVQIRIEHEIELAIIRRWIVVCILLHAIEEMIESRAIM